MDEFQAITATIIIALAGVLVGYLICKYVDTAIIRHEQNECRLWQQQAINFADAGFYLTSWQEAQCEAVGYPIKDTPIIPRNDNYLNL